MSCVLRELRAAKGSFGLDPGLETARQLLSQDPRPAQQVTLEGIERNTLRMRCLGIIEAQHVAKDDSRPVREGQPRNRLAQVAAELGGLRGNVRVGRRVEQGQRPEWAGAIVVAV